MENGREAVEQNEVSKLKCNGQVGEDESQDGEGSAHGKQPGRKKRKKKTKALSVGISAADDLDSVVVVGEEEGVGPVEVVLKYIKYENGGKEEGKQRKRKGRGKEEEEEGGREKGVKTKKESKRAQCVENVATDDGSCLESVANTRHMKEKLKKHKH